ncbi:unnamed protein product, partial [Choristocarpus tenellus]
MPILPLEGNDVLRNDEESFTISTNLPPMVGGELAGEMILCVPCIYLKRGALRPNHRPSDQQASKPLFVVRVQWWGESGPGTVFKPNVLDVQDKGGKMASQVVPSKATCALFPLRCGLDGLSAYLYDMGHVTLEVLLHNSNQRKSSQIGQCVIPMGGWDGRLQGKGQGQPLGEGRAVIADAYFPILATTEGRHVGEVCVQLVASFGPDCKLHRLLDTTDMDTSCASAGAEAGGLMKGLLGKNPPSRSDRTHGVVEEKEKSMGTGGRAGAAIWAQTESGAGKQTKMPSISGWVSHKDQDLPKNLASPPVQYSAIPVPGSLSSFQLNEALANFDDGDDLPVWPSARGVLYQLPEGKGEAEPRPHGTWQWSTRDRKRERKLGMGENSSDGPTTTTGVTFATAALTGREKWMSQVDSMRQGTHQNAHANPHENILGEVHQSLGQGKGDVLGDNQNHVQGWGENADGISSMSAQEIVCSTIETHGNSSIPISMREAVSAPSIGATSPGSPDPNHAKPPAPALKISSTDELLLVQLLNRGEKLRQQMEHAATEDVRAGVGVGLTVPTMMEDRLTSAVCTSGNRENEDQSSVPPSTALATLSTLAPPLPGFISGAVLGSSALDDIEGVFDALSQDGVDSISNDGAGSSDTRPRSRFWSAEARGHEARVIDLLLDAAGPPPSSLAFPALMALDRARSDLLARARFLRLRLHRLVMFGSMTSSVEGHGWQLRFCLPPFAAQPARGNKGGAAGSGRPEAGTGARVKCPQI